MTTGIKHFGDPIKIIIAVPTPSTVFIRANFKDIRISIHSNSKQRRVGEKLDFLSWLPRISKGFGVINPLEQKMMGLAVAVRLGLGLATDSLGVENSSLHHYHEGFGLKKETKKLKPKKRFQLKGLQEKFPFGVQNLAQKKVNLVLVDPYNQKRERREKKKKKKREPFWSIRSNFQNRHK